MVLIQTIPDILFFFDHLIKKMGKKPKNLTTETPQKL
jgi:hypothetical protein